MQSVYDATIRGIPGFAPRAVYDAAQAGDAHGIRSDCNSMMMMTRIGAGSDDDFCESGELGDRVLATEGHRHPAGSHGPHAAPTSQSSLENMLGEKSNAASSADKGGRRKPVIPAMSDPEPRRPA